MDARISNIEAGDAHPQVVVDTIALREQHRSWQTELAAYFCEYEPDVPWEDAEAALRAIARDAKVPLPA
jgi:hypothetical protein